MAAVVGAAAWRWAGARGLERRARTVPLACAVALAGAAHASRRSAASTGADTDAVATWAYDAAIVLTAGALAADLALGPHRCARPPPGSWLISPTARSLGPCGPRWPGPSAIPPSRSPTGSDEEWVDEAGQPVRLPAAEETEAAGRHGRGGRRHARGGARARPGGAARRARWRARSAPPCGWSWPTCGSRPRSPPACATSRPRADGSSRPATSSAAAFASNCGSAPEQTSRPRYRATLRRSPPRRPGRDGRRHSTSSSTELDAARGDLARFAQGVHPRALTEHGLAAALGELADQAAVPVALDVPHRRFPAPQEAAVLLRLLGGLGQRRQVRRARRASRIEVAPTGSAAARAGRRRRPPAAQTPHAAPACAGWRTAWRHSVGRCRSASPVGVGTRLEAELPIAAEAAT